MARIGKKTFAWEGTGADFYAIYIEPGHVDANAIDYEQPAGFLKNDQIDPTDGKYRINLANYPVVAGIDGPVTVAIASGEGDPEGGWASANLSDLFVKQGTVDFTPPPPVTVGGFE